MLFKPSSALGQLFEVAGPPSAALHWRGPIRQKQLSAVCTLGTTPPFVSYKLKYEASYGG